MIDRQGISPPLVYNNEALHAKKNHTDAKLQVQMVELGEDSGAKIWCKMLARVNNVERDSQIRKWNK